MALAKQKISLPLGGGTDTKTDVKQLPLGKFALIENGKFITPKKIRKRNGYAPLGTVLTQANALATFNNELLTFDGNKAYSLNQANSAWVSKGKFQQFNLSTSSVFKGFASASQPDCAYHSATGLALYTYVSATVPYYIIVDTTTGDTVVSATQIDASATQVPKPMVIGSIFLIFWVQGTKLQCTPIATGNPANSLTTFTVTSHVNSTAIFDAAVLNNRCFTAWYNDASSISMAFIDPSLAQSGILTITGDAASGGISIFPDPIAGNVWVGFYTGSVVKYFIRDFNLSGVPLLSTTTVETVANVANVCGNANNGTGYLFYEITSGNAYDHLTHKAVINNGGTGITTAVFLRSVGLGGKTFFQTVAGTPTTYVVLTHSSKFQSAYYIADHNGNLWAKISPGTGGGLYTSAQLPEIVPAGTNQFLFPFLQTDILSLSGGTVLSVLGVVSATLNAGEINNFQKETLGRHITFTGALPQMYDGVNIVEQNFNLFPENVTLAPVNGGSMTASGVYQYIVVYEWMDTQGNIHRSAPSVAVKITLSGGNQTVTVTIPTLRLTSKSNVICKVYRTQASGSTFNCVSDALGQVANSTSTDTVSFTDTYADSAILSNEILYTTGGVVEDFAPPALQSITTYKNRLCGLESADPLNIWYSKQVLSDLPVEFSDLFTMRIDSRGGPGYVLTVLDDKLIAFKAQSIFYFVGDGPAATGANNDFSSSIFITNDVGCTNKRSVVQTPLGIMFQSSKGIYLLNHALQTSYIGGAVEAYNSYTVTSAVLLQDTREVRFTMSNGVILMYDYFMDQWSVFSGLTAQDAVAFGGLYTFVNPTLSLINANVFQETPGLFQDNGEFIKLRIKTGWISFADVQGFQRLRRLRLLGDYLSPHQLFVSTAYDFDPNNASQTAIINPGSIFASDVFGGDTNFGSDAVFSGGTAAQIYQWQMHFTRQKCESVQLTIEDQQSGSYGEGYALSNLMFEVGVKQTPFKMPAANSFA